MTTKQQLEELRKAVREYEKASLEYQMHCNTVLQCKMHAADWIIRDNLQAKSSEAFTRMINLAKKGQHNAKA